MLGGRSCALALSLLAFSACRAEDHGEAEVVIDVGGAVPQDTPIPSGSADAQAAPQIIGFHAPEVVRPGQIVTLRMTTNYSPSEDISGAAIVVDGIDNWLKADVVPEPAAASDDGAWLIYLPVAIAGSADANDLTRIEIALLGPEDAAGEYREWKPTLDTSGEVVECPVDGDCSGLECGLDPLCATVCGTCPLDLACNVDNECEGIGGACPEAAMCNNRECGPDPVCNEDCGSCVPGYTCSTIGTCEVDPDDPGLAVTQLAAGSSHVCALFEDGSVKCWGDHAHGQLGLGNTDGHGDQVDEMGPGLPLVDLDSEASVSSLASGHDHTCALMSDGRVKCWGANSSGQLGIGEWTNRGDDADELGDELPSVNLGFEVEDLCAGASYSCALSTGGAVKCWGDNEFGQLGQGDTANRGGVGDELGDTLPAIDLGGDAEAISCDSRHACAQMSGASLKCWGYNQDGQLGLEDSEHRGDAADEMGNALAAVDLDGAVSSISTRWSHSCALVDGEVKCWGDNDNGGLGQGDDTPRGASAGSMGPNLDPVALGSFDTVELAVGFGHTCARSDAGEVKCWGFNGGGALGLGDTSARGDNAGEMGSSLPPVDLGNGESATALAVGNGFSCALLGEGRVKCWGSNAKGQLGLEDTNDRGNASGEMGDDLPYVDLW
jgi:alpha-tubulin suppressor-like RCC1 family protein